MTTLVLQATPFVEFVVAKLKAACLHVLHALDAFVAAKARDAVGECELRRTDRDIARYCLLLSSDSQTGQQTGVTQSLSRPRFPN